MYDDDDELLARLGGVVAEIDPVPAEVRRAARAAFGTRDLDGELAALVADSAHDGFEAVRAGDLFGPRLLSFACDGVQVDLEVSRAGDQVDLTGQVTGAAGHGCRLEYPRGATVELDLDSIGRFLVSGVPGGPIRLRCYSAGGVPVLTSWVAV
jgi:hypothetical protein